MKLLLVDDDPHILKSIPRILSVERPDWDVQTADCGGAALARMEHESFNVVLTDLRMPDMNGLELTKQISQLHPETLRVILTGQPNVESMLEAMGATHQYLSKPFDPDKLVDLLDRIEMVLSSLESPRILDLIGKCNALPPVPGIYLKIKEAVDSEKCSAREIGRILSEDPGLAAKALQIANSPLYGQRTPVPSIEQAINVLGMKTMASLALAQSLQPQSDPPEVEKLLREILEHSLAVATTARGLAAESNQTSERDAAFTAGLLHDIGKLALLRAFPTEYLNLVRTARESGQGIHELETSVWGGHHAGVGAYLLSVWGLPQNVIAAVAFHHEPVKCLQTTPLNLFVFAANAAHRGSWPRLSDLFPDSNPPDTVRPELFQQYQIWESRLDATGVLQR